MPNLTLSVTDKTKERMDSHPSIRWSNVVRSLIEKKLDDFEEAERLAQKSRLTQKDFEPILKKIESASRKHAKRLLSESYGGR